MELECKETPVRDGGGRTKLMQTTVEFAIAQARRGVGTRERVH